MSKCPPCGICGEAAPLFITGRAGTYYRCYRHEYINRTDTERAQP